MSRLLPTWKPSASVVTRPSAERVNELQPQKQTITVGGYGEIVPVVYGQAEVAGPTIAGPVVRSNVLYYAIALSHGPIQRIIKAFVGGDDEYTINKNPTAAGVEHTVTGDGYVYECWFYDGTQTVKNTTLNGVLTDFNDVFEGVAYVVIKASGVNASWDAIHFEIQGRKVFDPRTSTTVYSENPALHLNDFVSNDVWGLGRNVIGTIEAANECDRVLAYGPKSRTGHAIVSSASESANVELLAMYAEVLFGLSGDDIVIVPDAAVDESEITEIPYTQIWADSIRPSSKSAENIPSSITISFNTTDSDGLAGAPAYVSIEQTSASDPVINSSLTLTGVYRRDEAQRRANQRLAQLRTPGRISFQMFDSGIYFKAGDVIRMPDVMGLGGSEFRLIANPRMDRAGVYSIEGEVYNATAYAGDVIGTLSVPMNTLLARQDDFIPLNTATAGDAGFLLGSSVFSAASGDVDIPMPSNFTLGAAGQHSATEGPRLVPDTRAGGRGYTIRSHNPDNNHTHAVNAKGTIGLGSYNRTRFRGVVVTNPSGIDLPIGSIFFTRDSFSSPGSAKVAASGMLEIANDGVTGLVEKSKIELLSAGQHIHRDVVASRGIPSVGVGLGFNSASGGGEGGTHTHQIIITSDIPVLQQIRVIAYVSRTTQAYIPVGGIVPLVGVDPVPPGWALCNGDNGTHNLIDGFIGFDGDAEGSVAPEVSMGGISIAAGGEHTHSSTSSSSFVSQQGAYSNHPPEAGLHTHEIEWIGGNPFPITITPRYTKMRFIQYVGE